MKHLRIVVCCPLMVCVALGTSGLGAQEVVLVQAGTDLRYILPSAEPAGWIAPGFSDGSWSPGTYGVGYDAGAMIETTVPDPTRVVYTRARFTVSSLAGVSSVHFGADFDDGYVAWLNGVEIARDNMPPGTPSASSFADGTHESSNGSAPDYGTIADVTADALPALVEGENVLAVGVWNADAASSDLALVPFLSFNRPAPPSGGTPLCGTLSGVTQLTLAQSPYEVTCDVIVPRGSDLRIEAGVEIRVRGGFGIAIQGQIHAVGSADLPIRIFGTTGRFDGIAIDHASDGIVRDSRLSFVEISYGTTLLDVDGTGDSPILIDDVKLDRWSSLAVHWDNGCDALRLTRCELGVDTPLAEANHETVNGYRSGATIEYSTFGRRRDYNDVIDLGDTDWSGPVPTVQYNTFLGGDDDAIDFDGSAGWIIGNLVMNHWPQPGASGNANGGGITGNDGSDTVVMNNIVYRCYHGIGYKNECQPLIVNNLVLECHVGVTFYQDACDRGNPAATLFNNIIWGNRHETSGADQNVVLHGRWFPDYCQDAGDQGSADIRHSIVEGGWPGEGNTDADPLIADAENGDFSLLPGSPALEAAFGGPLARAGVPAAAIAAALALDHERRPRADLSCVADVGAGAFSYYDIGPLETQIPGPCTGEPLFRRADSNGDGNHDISDAVHMLLVLFAGATGDCDDARDVDDDGLANLTDPLVLLNYLFREGPAPAAPFPAAGVDPTADGLDCSR